MDKSVLLPSLTSIEIPMDIPKDILAEQDSPVS